MLIKNKKAFFDYHILEKIEAGIQLFGYEVKAVRQGKVSLPGSYISIKSGEVFLLNCDVAPYQVNNTPSNYDRKRERKLLLNRKEINKLIGLLDEKGTTLIPTSMYNKNGLIKLEIGVAKEKEVG